MHTGKRRGQKTRKESRFVWIASLCTISTASEIYVSSLNGCGFFFSPLYIFFNTLELKLADAMTLNEKFFANTHCVCVQFCGLPSLNISFFLAPALFFPSSAFFLFFLFAFNFFSVVPKKKKWDFYVEKKKITCKYNIVGSLSMGRNELLTEEHSSWTRTKTMNERVREQQKKKTRLWTLPQLIQWTDSITSKNWNWIAGTC